MGPLEYTFLAIVGGIILFFALLKTPILAPMHSFIIDNQKKKRESSNNREEDATRDIVKQIMELKMFQELTLFSSTKIVRLPGGWHYSIEKQGNSGFIAALIIMAFAVLMIQIVGSLIPDVTSKPVFFAAIFAGSVLFIYRVLDKKEEKTFFVPYTEDDSKIAEAISKP